MTPCVKYFAAALVAAAFVSQGRAETPEGEIRRAIAALGDDDVEKRDAAQALLREIGPEAALLFESKEKVHDAEVRRRTSELLDEWGFGGDDEPGGAVRQRLFPWIDIEKSAALKDWPRLEDDRIAEVVARGPKRNDYASFDGYLARSDVPLTPGLMKALLPGLREHGAMSLAAREQLEMPEESRRLLLEDLHGEPFPEDESRLVLLWRLGEQTPLLDRLRTAKPISRYAEFWDVLAHDPEFLAAVGEAFEKSSMSEEIAIRFHSEKFATYYRDAEDAWRLAELRAEIASPLLKSLLKSPRSPVRLRAALALSAFGEQVEELNLWDTPEAWIVDHDPVDSLDAPRWRFKPFPTDLLIPAAPTLPLTPTCGASIENRLRNLIDDPVASTTWFSRLAFLRGLAARRRERDITFIYGQLKELPPEFQSTIAVDLARVGSAAGVGILIPHLYGCGWALRRDANEALKKITGQDFCYDPAGTLPQRCRKARKWAIWWRENRTSFHPDVK